MLSVTAETATHSTHAFWRTNGTPDHGSTPSTGFSALVDSNTDAATAGRGDSDQPRPSNDHQTPTRDDAPPSDATRDRNTASANSDGKPAATSDDAQPNAATTDASSQQPADGQAAPTAATADGKVTAGAAAQAQSNGKDKATAKGDKTDDTTVVTADPSVQVDQATTLIVAVVAEVVSSNSIQPAALASDAGQAGVAAPAAVTSAPGAIAAAAASKVAADIGATEPAAVTSSNGAAVQAQTTDTNNGAVAQIQVAANPQAQASLPAELATTQLTSPGQNDAAVAEQALVLNQAAAPTKVSAQIVPSAKSGKTTTITAEPTVSSNAVAKSPVVDPRDTAPATDDARPATEPVTANNSATTPSREAPAEASAKPQSDADAPAAPTIHQHTTTTELRIAQPSVSTPTPDAATTAQATAANNAATIASPPTAATALNPANLTVMIAQTVPLNGLAVEISANAKAGNSRFEIRLDPPELGRIDVRLDVDRNGQVTSRLFVEKSETLDLLRRDAPQLQQALQDAGLKTSDSGLQFSLRDQNPQQGRNDGNGSGQNPQRLVIVEDDAATASAAGRSYGRSLSASGGVDIRV